MVLNGRIEVLPEGDSITFKDLRNGKSVSFDKANYEEILTGFRRCINKGNYVRGNYTHLQRVFIERLLMDTVSYEESQKHITGLLSLGTITDKVKDIIISDAVTRSLK